MRKVNGDMVKYENKLFDIKQGGTTMCVHRYSHDEAAEKTKVIFLDYLQGYAFN